MDFIKAGCKITHLHKDEITHELAIRRLPVNPVSRRTSLCQALKETVELARKGSLKFQDLVVNDPVGEIKLCQDKIQEIEREVSDDISAVAKDRLLSRCKYLICRLSRLDQNLEEVQLLKGTVSTIMEQLLGDDSSASSESGGEDPASAVGDRIVREVVYKPEKTFNINSLNLKFKGDTCVRSFLSRLEELRVARRISENRIYRGFPEILEGPALSWFRSQRTDLLSYREVVSALREEFDIPDLDHLLLQEIRNRTQAKSETIVYFVSTMLGMYDRLSRQVPEEDKLDTLMRNIRPEFSKDLALHDVRSIKQLKDLCRRIELAQVKAKQFHEPLLSKKSGSSSLGTEENKGETRNRFGSARTSNMSKTFVAAVGQTSSGRNDLCCFRCGKTNHPTRACRSSRETVCFKCGAKGVRTPECPKCNPVPKN
ncbi:uncharacterized protein LOC125240446 [Leguminivora glycinivorella]|uniref:uncharacterized protein LOC125240446 n=1 Tax=Leguminivora glycinivorella TaxID=1035111 RepID=UPI00200E1394|nr:uncharacterized protein LOC125240446 [Leguminivora glycinivorella]